MAIKGLGNGLSTYESIKITREAERHDDAAKGVKNPSTKRDEVSVSEDARLMNVAMETIRNTPETRADKVARLKAMVQGGSYEPNASAIAEKMVDEDLELLA